MLAGMIMRPRATSSRTVSGARRSRLRDVFHLLGDPALAGVMHLRPDAVAGAPRYPFVSHTALIILA